MCNNIVMLCLKELLAEVDFSPSRLVNTVFAVFSNFLRYIMYITVQGCNYHWVMSQDQSLRAL